MPDKSPYQLFREAAKVRPFGKYLVTILGIFSGLAILKSYQIDLRLAAIGSAMTIFFMTLLVIFAKLEKSKSKHFQAPVKIMLWTSILLWTVFVVLLLTSIFFRTPINLSHWLADDRVKESFQFETDHDLKVLILPFSGNCLEHNQKSDSELAFENTLNSRSEAKDLKIQAKYIPNSVCPKNREEAYKIGRKFKSNIIIWGGLDSCGLGPITCLRYVFIDPDLNDQLDSNSKSKFRIPRTNQTASGLLTTELEYLLFWSIGRGYFSQEKWGKALEFFERSVVVSEIENPDNYFYMAECYRQLNEYELAETNYQRALAIGAKMEDDEIITNLNTGFGRYFYEKGDYGSSEKYLELAKSQAETTYGVSSPEMAFIYGSLASMQFRKGDFESAGENYQKDLDLCLEIYGRKHPSTMTALNNVAFFYSRIAKNEEALRYFREVLDYRKKYLGVRHPYTVTTYSSVAFALEAIGKRKEALDHFKKSLMLHKEVYGETHSGTAQVLNNLGVFFYREEDYPRAVSYLEEAYQVYIKIFGKEHPKVVITMNNIGAIALKAKEYEKSEKYLLEAMAISQKKSGDNHPDTAKCMKNLGSLYVEVGKKEEGLALMKKAVDVFEAHLGSDHPSTKLVKGQIAKIEEER